MLGKGGQKKQILYDTSVVIGYLRGKTECKSKVEAIRKGKVIGFVSVVTVFELYIGAFLAPNISEALRDVREILSWFQTPLALDEVVAQKAAYLFTQLRKTSELIELSDLFIAATALVLGLPMTTLNRTHFVRIPKLRLLD